MQLAQFSWINKAWMTISTIVSNVLRRGENTLNSQNAKQMSKLTEQKQCKVEKIIPQNTFSNPQTNPFTVKSQKKSNIFSIQEVNRNKNRYLKNWLESNQKSKKKVEQLKRTNRFWESKQQINTNTQARTQCQTKMKDQNSPRELQYLRKYQQSLQKSKIQFLNKSKSEFDRFQIESSQFQESPANNLYSECKSPFAKKKQKSKKISFKKYLKSGLADISPNGLFRDMKGDDISSIQRHSEMIEQSEPQIVRFAQIPLAPTTTTQAKNVVQPKNKQAHSSQPKKIPDQKRTLFVRQTEVKSINVNPDLKFMIDFKLQQQGLYPQMAYGKNSQIRKKVYDVTQKAIDQFNRYQRKCQQNRFVPIYNSAEQIKFDELISFDQGYQQQQQNQGDIDVGNNLLDQISQYIQKQPQKQEEKSPQQKSPFKPVVNWKRVLSDDIIFQKQYNPKDKDKPSSMQKKNQTNSKAQPKSIKKKQPNQKYQCENNLQQDIAESPRKKRHF